MSVGVAVGVQRSNLGDAELVAEDCWS